MATEKEVKTEEEVSTDPDDETSEQMVQFDKEKEEFVQKEYKRIMSG